MEYSDRLLDRINRITPSAAKGPLAWRRGKIEEVLHDSVIAGDFFADMLVEGAVMVENKSVQNCLEILSILLILSKLVLYYLHVRFCLPLNAFPP